AIWYRWADLRAHSSSAHEVRPAITHCFRVLKGHQSGSNMINWGALRECHAYTNAFVLRDGRRSARTCRVCGLRVLVLLHHSERHRRRRDAPAAGTRTLELGVPCTIGARPILQGPIELQQLLWRAGHP